MTSPILDVPDFLKRPMALPDWPGREPMLSPITRWALIFGLAVLILGLLMFTAKSTFCPMLILKKDGTVWECG